MAQKTRPVLRTQAQLIRNETVANQNTAIRVGGHLEDTSDSHLMAVNGSGTTYNATDDRLDFGGSFLADVNIDLATFDLIFKNAASDVMTIDAAGKVGIGISSPITKLHVYGDVVNTHLARFSSDSDSRILDVYDYGFVFRQPTGYIDNQDAGGNLYFRTYDGVGIKDRLKIFGDSGDVMSFHGYDGTEYMRLNGGNLVVGDTTPDAKLHIRTGSDEALVAKFEGTSSYLQLWDTGLHGYSPTLDIKNNYPTGNIKLQTHNGVASQERIFISGSTNIMNFHDYSGNLFLQLDSQGAQRATLTNPVADKDFVIKTNNGIASQDRIFITGNSDVMKFHNHDGVEEMRLSSGKLGIGTTSPAYSLSIYGNNARTQYTDSVTGITTTDGVIVGLDGSQHGFLWNYENKDLYFGTNNTKRMTIDSAGDVGIGTESPNSELEVSGDNDIIRMSYAAATAGYMLGVKNAVNHWYLGAGSGGTDNIELWNYLSGIIRFGTDNTERMRIDSAGNVGIGTNAPLSGLHIDTTSSSSLRMERGANIWGFDINATDGIGLYSYTGATFAWYALNSGDVGIGTSSPSYKLDVSGGDVSFDNNQFLRTKNAASSSVRLIGMNASNNIFIGGIDGGHTGTLNFRTGGVDRATMNNSGKLGLGTSVPDQLLHIEGADPRIQIEDSVDGIIGYIGNANNFITSATGGTLGIRGEGAISFAADGAAENMRLSGGELFLKNSSGLAYFEIQEASQDVFLINPTTDKSIFIQTNNGTGAKSRIFIPGYDDEISLYNHDGTKFLSLDSVTGASYISTDVNQDDLTFRTKNTSLYSRYSIIGDADTHIWYNDTGTEMMRLSGTDGNLEVQSAIQMGDDSGTATAAKVGTMRYRSDANNSYVDMCMQTGASTYAWVNIKTNTW